MNIVDRVIASVSPQRALDRVRARMALQVLANYQATTSGRRSKSWQAKGGDADAAAAKRERLAFIARDMIRNTPLAVRGQSVIVNAVVGDGIIPKVDGGSAALVKQGRQLIADHFDTVAIDADGRSNLYGLQRLALNCIVDSGEVLIRRRLRSKSDGLPLPFQIQLLEPDYLDASRDGQLRNGHVVIEGIEFDRRGRRAAYWLFDEHPGSVNRWRSLRPNSRRVPASEVIHVYRQDRAGQRRGTSWFAPVALSMQDVADSVDAKLMQQKIAACFAAFRVNMDPEADANDDPAITDTLQPGAIYDLMPGEDIKFGDPPSVEGFDELTRVVSRQVAVGLGITYEALTGDLSGVNFTSGRMGRMDMDRNVSSWQWLMMIPQLCQPLGGWFREAWMTETAQPAVARTRLSWVPPHRQLVDPTREIPALAAKIKAGLASRQGVQRELGYDPEVIDAEILEDQKLGLLFSSSPEPLRLPPPANSNGGPSNA